MKKKSRFLINIALLALSLCIMVYGVYSAKQATLNVTGSIGFQAHNADIALTSVKVTGSADTATIKDGPTSVTSLTNISGRTLTFGGLRFKDDGTSATSWKPATKIVLTFNFKNNSAFSVTCSAPAPTNQSGKVTFESNITTTTTIAAGGTKEVTITLTCDAIETYDATSFSSTISFTKAS
ncbi:MAG: hypothetical protein MR904_00020 [Clostridia bacterium]|nr:hypothetical protein [Clostridia bacterium]